MMSRKICWTPYRLSIFVDDMMTTKKNFIINARMRYTRMGSKYFGVQNMDKQKASRIANQYIKFVKSMNPDVTRAYIFGSYAKGGIREDSDIDLAIVFKNLSDLFDMQVTLMKLRRQFDTRIEPHPFRESDFQTSNPLANEILKTGIRIM
jgi:uncharacterized protein